MQLLKTVELTTEIFATINFDQMVIKSFNLMNDANGNVIDSKWRKM